MTEGAAEVLERLNGSALTSCRVNLIALDAVARAFGARWANKKTQVYEQVERVLGRNLREGGYFVRVSPTDFLVVQSDIGEFAAQAICCRSFEEIWTHFLGQAPQTERAVHRVTEFTAEQITAVEVDRAAALAGEAREAVEAQQRAEREAAWAASPLWSRRWAPFIASNGRRVDVVCRIEPVFNLKTYDRIALRLGRQVIDLSDGEAMSRQEIAGLSRSDMFRVDMATMSRALSRLREQTNGEPVLSLIVPASYIVLSHAQSRQAFTGALRELRPWARTGLILEIRDLSGVPHAGLAEAISILKPACLLVTGHLHEPPARSLKGVGLQAVSVSCPASIEGDASFIGWLRPWLRAARIVARSVMIYRCASPGRMALAGVFGATHASAAPDPASPAPDGPVSAALPEP